MQAKTLLDDNQLAIQGGLIPMHVYILTPKFFISNIIEKELNQLINDTLIHMPLFFV